MVSLKDIGDIIKNINSPIWADGFLVGCWLVFTVLLTFSFFGTNLEYIGSLPKQNIQENYAFKIPNSQNNIYSGNITSKCLNNFRFENPNGVKFSGRICTGQKIPLEDYYLEIVDLNQAIENPITIKLYKRISIRWLFVILVIGVPLLLILKVYYRKKRKKEFQERLKRTRKIDEKMKKLGLSPKELKKYIIDRIKEE